jgi:GT2 family glycosyltransferase
MESDPRLGGLMPRLLDADGRPTHFVGRAPRLLAVRMRFQRALIWRFPNVPAVRRYWERSSAEYLRHSAEEGLFPRKQLEGAALMVRREAFEIAGRFDPAFFCGWEETDLTMRLRRAGWRLAVTAAATARHRDQQSRLQWKARPWEIPDGFYFVRKHRGKWGLLRHAWAERSRRRHHARAGADVVMMQREQQRAFRELWKSPAHPGYPADWRSHGPAQTPASHL